MKVLLKPIDYAKMACDTIMRKYTVEELPIPKKFHYHQGVFLSGMERTYLSVKDEKYNQYIKAWVDCIITPEGVISNYDKTTLDDFRAGVLLYRLHETTGDTRYEKAIKTIKNHLDSFKVNSEGGFFHMERCENQMWLDGLYMAGPFLAMYGARYHDETCFETVYTQLNLMWKHCRDNKSGLLYHVWDASKNAEWADKNTGCSSFFWGRAIGWYIVALCDIMDDVPKKWKHREEVLEYIRLCIEAIAKYQDMESGCWYQVVDKGDREDNWIELSCSALFVYAISKAMRMGYIDRSQYKSIADRGYSGIIKYIELLEDGTLIVPKVCIGTGVGDYKHYIERPTTENDLHGMGAFILCCNEYDELINSQ